VTLPETQDVPAARRRSNLRQARRRLVYLLVSLPVVIALVVLAVALIRPSVVTQGALDAFDAGRYESSAEGSTSLLENNILEPWIPWFNRGDALAAQEQYTDAIDDFERALALAPADRACDVRVNLALSWERLGDIYIEGGFPQGAVLLYEQAAAVIAAGTDCEPPEPAGMQLDAAGPRVQEKIEEAERQRDAADAAEGDEGPQTREEQLEKLEELGRRGAEDKANGDAADRGEEGGSSGFTDKPW
jgi:tetratricopeptide (TPR) repeat protein